MVHVNPETTTQAVAEAAARLGIELPPGAASALATAALTHADNVHATMHVAWREEWALPRYRDHTRKQMQHQLLEELIEKHVLPVTLPAEKITYHLTSLPGTEPVPEAAPWEQVHILLRVKTRNARGD